MLVLKAGITRGGDGITSVSNGGVIFLGDGGPSPIPKLEDRLDTLIFFPLPALPTAVAAALTLRGDLRGDFFGDERETRLCSRTGSVSADVDGGPGVGGKSASINSTCHERFSSKNLIRSALPITRNVSHNGSAVITHERSPLMLLSLVRVELQLQ